MAKPRNVSRSYRVNDGRGFRLKDFDPGDTGGIQSQEEARDLIEGGLSSLRDLQEKHYAQDQWAVLLILQAMDAAGKDSLVKHVMSGVNPTGCRVYSFKKPSIEELDHDFLWRTTKSLPERGKIGIFNRSYYEEVLMVRVHPEALAEEKIPSSLITKKLWRERFEDICAFERYLARNGVVTRKFFLHVSEEKQKERFLSRLDNPRKSWKFEADDVKERKHWREYMRAYEEMIRNTARPHAPWYVVPADNKWFTQLVVAEAIVETLEELNLEYPKLDKQRRKELHAAHAQLSKQKH
ncbi:MAG TPA: polyphosphate kinase 2 family protein [Bryobacteraceae bacterium]|nr:polyphosphate kinase 2 family protein [Bryobacteraceae bacterium]HXR74667.1 polyphosphate kinase 2 family protein [Bryobacteraceae bacterium]